MAKIVFTSQCCVDGCYRKHMIAHGMCKEHQDMYDRGLRLTINYGQAVQKPPTAPNNEFKATKAP